MNEWVGADGKIGALVAAETERCLAAYRAKPNLVEQDAGIEISNVEGGYGRKQLHELVQNGADAMHAGGGRISVTLTADRLYCANQGEPLTSRGVEALMASHLSIKRDDQIGRFGLGFKSVLGISDTPEIFSRSGSLRFDRNRARQRILAVVPGAQRTPVLRVADPADPAVAAANDPVLRDLMAWATTVVRLPLVERSGWLAEEVSRFPSEFMLFAGHVGKLELHDLVAHRSEVWTADRQGSRVVISGNRGAGVWNVFRRQHRPSDAARADAGEIAGRDTVEVVWAVPAKGRSAAGQFWSFFPTTSRSTLSGIVNAPFKTTEDRHDILDGRYNRELLEDVLPDIVSAALPELVDPADPCSLFEILPARGKEARSWADDSLNEPVMRAVAASACVPDQDGRLGRIDQIKLSPRLVSDHGRWSDMWSGVPAAPHDWIHPSVDQTAERRAKATRLYEINGSTEASPRQWLQALAKTGARGSMVAVQLANLIDKSEPDHIVAVRQSLIVLCADGKLVAPVPGKVFLPDPDGSPAEPRFIARALVDDAETLDALTELGIKPLDASGRLLGQIAQMRGGASKGMDVERLWSLVRALPQQDAVRLLEQGFGHGGTPVRTLAAKPARVDACLIPGSIVPSDGSRDAAFTVDMRFHATDHDVLAGLAAVAGPRLLPPRPGEKWFREWRAFAHDTYLAAARDRGVRVSPASVSVRLGRTAARLDLLPLLSSPARIAFTREVLRLATEDWVVYAEARGAIGPVRVTNPGIWWIRRHGMVRTAMGACSIADAVAPLADLSATVIPVPVDLDASELQLLDIQPPTGTGEWQRLIGLGEARLGAAHLAVLYAAAARAGCPRPATVRLGEVGAERIPIDDILVTGDEVAFSLLKDVNDVLLASDQRDVDTLIETWGLRDASQLLQRNVLHAASGELIPLLDRFPGLRVTASGRPTAFDLLPCSELAVEVTAEGQPASVLDQRTLLDGNVYYFRDDLTASALLMAVNHDLRLGLDERRKLQTLDIGRRMETNKTVSTVRAAETVEEKLLALAGEEEIRKLVPADAIRVAEVRKGRSLQSTEIARMAKGAVGGQIIKKLAPVIESRGIAVPTRFSGSSAATSFTRDLGLPAQYAGSREDQRPEVETVPGPVRLPPLHDYQETSIVRIRALLREGGPNRGLLALPTGSGKTRVAVEALVDHIREVDPSALILWIAQTDELCEQAVESWSYVWRAVGPHEADLTVNRLWGSNDAARADKGAQVVIATDDKLLSLSRRNGHEWLTAASVVVVDEAHTSISRTYTELFSWLGRGTRQRERPLLGLSATPYRGTNEEQTRLLVNRYDRNLLTDGLFGNRDPHIALQEMGILARVRHQVLDGIELRPIETGPRDDGERFSLLEARIDMQQVARDDERNSRILDSLLKLDDATTALVFAASVQHAEQLAAVLEIEGIPAAAVSAFTPSPERRARVRLFQNGDVRVLTNYNVLSQGFDAPRVGAVYVARPTFSPNRYQQMIGRGLRGPRNGGSSEVLIVNVQDNITAFGEQLAFHHFDQLWRDE
jgi:superfamily II DNA or RNA helicase